MFAAFFAITPCGLDGVAMTCLEAEAGRIVPMADAAAVLTAELRGAFGAAR